MFKKFMKRYLKNQRGLTLIELLATIVILGIISAIAVPAIGGLIDNSKKDAEVANAQQVINSAKLYVTSHTDKFTAATTYIPLNVLYTDHQLEPMKDPYGTGDYAKGSETDITTSAAPTTGTYVEVDLASGNYSYKIMLVQNGKLANYFSASDNTTTGAVDDTRLKRDFVVKPS